jgi:transposase InsO family protein
LKQLEEKNQRLKRMVADLSLDKQMDNAFIELLNGSFRDECLNVIWLLSIEDEREKIDKWRQDYDELRPHSLLGDLTPRASTSISTYILAFLIGNPRSLECF